MKKEVNYGGFGKKLLGWFEVQIVVMEKYIYKYFLFRVIFFFVCVLNSKIRKDEKMSKNVIEVFLIEN